MGRHRDDVSAETLKAIDKALGKLERALDAADTPTQKPKPKPKRSQDDLSEKTLIAVDTAFKRLDRALEKAARDDAARRSEEAVRRAAAEAGSALRRVKPRRSRP